MDLALYSAVVGTVAVVLILCEWSYIILWTRTTGRTIVSGVLGSLNNLRPGRGRGPTATERMRDAASEEPEIPAGAAGGPPAPQPPMNLPNVPAIAGIDPRALIEGKPILDKFMAGQKLSPEEMTKGLSILRYLQGAAASQGNGANGGAAGAPTESGWG